MKTSDALCSKSLHGRGVTARLVQLASSPCRGKRRQAVRPSIGTRDISSFTVDPVAWRVANDMHAGLIPPTIDMHAAQRVPCAQAMFNTLSCLRRVCSGPILAGRRWSAMLGRGQPTQLSSELLTRMV